MRNGERDDLQVFCAIILQHKICAASEHRTLHQEREPKGIQVVRLDFQLQIMSKRIQR